MGRCRVARDSREHFSRIDDLQQEQRYYFKFLSPRSLDLFFKALRKKRRLRGLQIGA
jgi:hypothetical protein